jgi:hypothetical protein
MKIISLAFSIVCLSMAFAFFLLWRRDPSIAGENHIMENLQVVCLLLSLFFIFLTLLREKAWNLSFSFLFLSFLTILLREVDMRPFPLPRFVILLSTKGRNIALFLGWSLFTYSFVRNLKTALNDFTAFGRKAAGGYFMLGCLFYGLAAWPFDEGIFGMSKDMNSFFEELLENMGALSFAISAFFFCRDRIPLSSEKAKIKR